MAEGGNARYKFKLGSNAAAVEKQLQFVTVIVSSLMTGEVLAEAYVPRSWTIAQVKHFMEKQTKKSAFNMKIMTQDGRHISQDFSCLNEIEEDPSDLAVIRLNVVFVNPFQVDGDPDLFSTRGLPYDALDREYMPSNGLLSSAHGNAGYQTSQPSPSPVLVA